MATGAICDVCGKAFPLEQGFAVAIAIGGRPFPPFNEAPFWQEACSTICAAKLASASAKDRMEREKADQAHRVQVEKMALAQQAQDAIDLANEVQRIRAERLRLAAENIVGPPPESVASQSEG